MIIDVVKIVTEILKSSKSNRACQKIRDNETSCLLPVSPILKRGRSLAEK